MVHLLATTSLLSSYCISRPIVNRNSRHGRHRRPLRRLASFGGATTDRRPAPLVPGRGGYGTGRRQCPTGRTALRPGTRHGREGTARVSSGGALRGELRRARPTAERRQGPAIGGGHPRDRGSPYVC